MVLGLETNRGMAGALLDIEIFNLGKDFVERYPDIINRVSREAIIEAARTYLSTENYVLAVAGPEISQNG
jgi:zinc protease